MNNMNQNINWKGEPGRLIRVAVGQNGVWGVNNAHEIYKKTPTSWEKIAGRLKDISVGKDTGNSACRLHSILLSQVLVLLWVCVFNVF